MAKPYSSDLRARIVRSVEEGVTLEETAERHHVSLSTVVRLLRLKRETGSVIPAQFGGYKRHKLASHEGRIRQWVAEQPDITLAELKAKLTKVKVMVSQSSIFRFLRHLNLTFKKKPSRRRAGPAGRRRRAPSLTKTATEA